MERSHGQHCQFHFRYNSIDVGDTSIWSVNIDPGMEMTWHAHERPSFHLMLAGSTTECDDHQAVEYLPGGVWHREAHQEHRDTFGGRGALVLLFLLGRRLAHLARPIASASLPIARDENPLLKLGAQMRVELANQAPCTGMAAEGLVLQIMAEVIRQLTPRTDSPEPPGWLEHVRRRLDTLPLEHSLSCAELADEVDKSSTHLSRHFRRQFGVGVPGYMRVRRVRAAEHRLSAGNDDLNRIALNCGFYDQSHFCRHFKRVNGMTPSQYRQALRRNS